MFQHSGWGFLSKEHITYISILKTETKFYDTFGHEKKFKSQEELSPTLK